jgi:pimeloyl-ACP methyl ester carboxylesterase
MNFPENVRCRQVFSSICLEIFIPINFIGILNLQRSIYMKVLTEDFYVSTIEDSSTPKSGRVYLETGIRMHFLEQGDADGEPLILLHGITDSSFSYSRVLPLIDKKYRVFALDQRGHGDSDRPNDGYTMKNFAADVTAFMDAKNIRQAILVGHSMGSFVALQTALDAPGRIEKLILIGTATTARNDGTGEFQKEVSRLTDPIPENFVREFQSGTAFHPLPEEFLSRVVQESLKVPARVWQAALSGVLAEDYKSRLSEIKVPTLIVWGERETYFPRAEQELLTAEIPDSTLKIYPDTGHSPQWERPEVFVRDLNDFLRAGNRS